MKTKIYYRTKDGKITEDINEALQLIGEKDGFSYYFANGTSVEKLDEPVSG